MQPRQPRPESFLRCQFGDHSGIRKSLLRQQWEMDMLARGFTPDEIELKRADNKAA